jgi:tetraspanin-18
MCLASGSFLAKYFLYVLNLVFSLAGVASLAAGTWIVLGAQSFLDFMRFKFGDELITEIQKIAQPTAIQQAAYILIVAGILVFLISFSGYLGACRESRNFLIGYGVCITTILILEIIAGILAATYSREAEENTRSFLKFSINVYYTAEEKDVVTLMWDYTMASMKCCGVDSYEDFEESEKWTEGNEKIIPEACCILEGDISKFQPKDQNCTQSPSDANSYWKKGCYNAIAEKVDEYKVTTIAIGIGLAVLKLVIILVALFFCRSLQKRQNRDDSGSVSEKEEPV